MFCFISFSFIHIIFFYFISLKKRNLPYLMFLLSMYSISSHVSFVGVSAGVDQGLSLVSAKHQFDTYQMFAVHSFTGIAGAAHPTLFKQCFDTFLEDDTYVLVLHHTQDRHCLWRDVRPLWSRFA